MRTITLKIDVSTLRSTKGAEEFAKSVAAHLRETFNDDNSLTDIETGVVPTKLPGHSLRLRHFENVQAVCDYIAQEFEETLQDDYDKMCGDERQHYENEDRADMRGKLADVRAVENALRHLPDLLQFVWNMGQMQTDEEFGEDSPPSEDWISTLSDLIVTARTLGIKAR